MPDQNLIYAAGVEPDGSIGMTVGMHTYADAKRSLLDAGYPLSRIVPAPHALVGRAYRFDLKERKLVALPGADRDLLVARR